MDPKDTNNADQNTVKQDPSQNTLNQNTAFPSQSLQPAQNVTLLEQNPQPTQSAAFPNQSLQPVQNSPLLTSPTKSKKPILITCIVGVIILVAAIVGLIYIMAIQNDDNQANDTINNITDNSNRGTTEEVNPNATENATLDVSGAVDVEKFKQMTKAEAIAFLQAGQNTAGNMPKNYVSEEITNLIIVEDHVVKSDVKLEYSHDTIDDLRQIAEEWYGILGHNDGITEDDYEIKEYDYYAIIIPNRLEGTNTCDYDYYGDCKSLLSFKRNYINHFQEQTAPSSYNDVAYLNVQNLDLETIEYLLRIFSLFHQYGIASAHGNIYGSSFKEQDDKFVLTVYYVGVGIDIEKLKAGNDIGYAINLYSRQYAADKADGRLHVIQTEEDSTVENIKSIPITQKEATLLLSR